MAVINGLLVRVCQDCAALRLLSPAIVRNALFNTVVHAGDRRTIRPLAGRVGSIDVEVVAVERSSGPEGEQQAAVGAHTIVEVLPPVPVLTNTFIVRGHCDELTAVLRGRRAVQPQGFFVLLEGALGSGKTSAAVLSCKEAELLTLYTSAHDIYRTAVGGVSSVCRAIEDLSKRAAKAARLVNRSKPKQSTDGAVDAAVVLDDMDFLLQADAGNALTHALRHCVEVNAVVVLGVCQDVRKVPSALRQFCEFVLSLPPFPAPRDAARLLAASLGDYHSDERRLAGEVEGLRAENCILVAKEWTLHGHEGADLPLLLRNAREAAQARGHRMGLLDASAASVPSTLPSSSLLPTSSVEPPETRAKPVSMSEVIGLDAVRRSLREMMLWPRERAADLRRLGVRMPIGALLYGAAGSGKTTLVRRVAHECGHGIVALDAASLMQGAVGDSERALEAAFKLTRSSSPCVLFIDEIDCLFQSRTFYRDGEEGRANDDAGNPDEQNFAAESRLVTALVFELELSNTIVIAATNRPWAIDPALLRVGRLEVSLYTPLPDQSGRVKLLDQLANKLNLSESAADHFRSYASRSQGLTGADLEGVARRAVHSMATKGDATVDIEHLDDAISQTVPSISAMDLLRLSTWRTS